MIFRRYESMFIWDERYSVGIQEIDEQHKQIFAILDKLYNLLKVGQTDYVAAQIIPELEEYTIFHFEKEEQLLGRYHYSEVEEHIQEHENFKLRLREIKDEIRSGRVTLGFELMIFLKKWIDHHILVVDKHYSLCLKENGLK